MENPITNKEQGKVLFLCWKDLIIGVNSTNICAVGKGVSQQIWGFHTQGSLEFPAGLWLAGRSGWSGSAHWEEGLEGSVTLPVEGSALMLARLLRNECTHWLWLFAGSLSVSQVLSLSLFAEVHWDIDWNLNNPLGIHSLRERLSVGTEAISMFRTHSFKGSSPPLAVCTWVGSTRISTEETVSHHSLTSAQQQDSQGPALKHSYQHSVLCDFVKH